VRAHTAAYLAASATGSFLAAYFVYIELDRIALSTILLSLLFYPVLAFTDRVVYDGRRLYRTGLIWKIWMKLTGQPRRIRPRSIVHVETETLRALRRGTNITYLYRTTLFGANISFRIGSGAGYRNMIRDVLPLIPEGCLDIRSLELRDHLINPSMALGHARALNIPRSDVLDPTGALDSARGNRRERYVADADQVQKADELRTVANELRANGRLVQAIEAFRRAFRLNPRNGPLLYDFGRCMQSLAAAKKDPALERRSRAILRLAEAHSAGDVDLLTRLGETYFSAGLWQRAENAFKKASASKAAGYRIFRGLGELALRDGKIAHAINYFAQSAEVAKSKQLFRWATAETEYLRRINDDDEYMELELGRINLFDTFNGVRRTSLRIFLFGVLVTILGLFGGGEIVAEVGWAISGVSLFTSIASTLLRQTFASRIPFEMLNKDE